MKIIVCNNEGSFGIEGKDFESIARLLLLPPWAITVYQAWSRNGWRDDLTLHVAEGFTVMVEAPAKEPVVAVPESELAAVFHKASLYSDFHKDFYGTRPIYDGASPRELAARFDAIHSEIQVMKSTPEGRAKLRADGWEVPAEPARKPAKKVARRFP